MRMARFSMNVGNSVALLNFRQMMPKLVMPQSCKRPFINRR